LEGDVDLGKKGTQVCPDEILAFISQLNQTIESPSINSTAILPLYNAM
jgi:hypothetical protein